MVGELLKNKNKKRDLGSHTNPRNTCLHKHFAKHPMQKPKKKKEKKKEKEKEKEEELKRTKHPQLGMPLLFLP